MGQDYIAYGMHFLRFVHIIRERQNQKILLCLCKILLRSCHHKFPCIHALQFIGKSLTLCKCLLENMKIPLAMIALRQMKNFNIAFKYHRRQIYRFVNGINPGKFPQTLI